METTKPGLIGNRNGVGPKRWTFRKDMTRDKAEEIRRLYFSRQAKQRELAEMFNTTQANISRIVSGITWA